MALALGTLSAIVEEVAQPRETADDFRQQQRRPVAVLDVGGVDQGVDEVALGVGKDMPLATLDLLARVIAARTAAFRRFDAPSIDYSGAGRSLAAVHLARDHQQVMVEASPQAIVAPQSNQRRTVKTGGKQGDKGDLRRFAHGRSCGQPRRARHQNMWWRSCATRGWAC